VAILDRTLATPASKAKSQLRLVPILVLACGAIAVIGLLRIVQTSQATTAGFAMTSLQQEKLELETSVTQLEAEVATLSSIERIEREATRLGLEAPAGVSYLEVGAIWPGEASQVLPARFAPKEEDQVDGSPDNSGWWQDLLKQLPFY